MINWKVRLKSPAFWTGLIGVLGAFAVGMAQLFGVDITAEAGSWQQALTALVTAVFGVLALVGVTTDPTTKGLNRKKRSQGLLRALPWSRSSSSKK